jgi:hypothetical protein
MVFGLSGWCFWEHKYMTITPACDDDHDDHAHDIRMMQKYGTKLVV